MQLGSERNKAQREKEKLGKESNIHTQKEKEKRQKERNGESGFSVHYCDYMPAQSSPFFRQKRSDDSHKSLIYF